MISGWSKISGTFRSCVRCPFYSENSSLFLSPLCHYFGSGRLLVGLRWWNSVREDGTNEWVFESLEDLSELSNFDSRVFWLSLYGACVMWILLLLIGVLRLQFDHIPIVAAALALNFANVVGYTKCSNSAKARLQAIMEQGRSLNSSAMSSLQNSSIRNLLFSYFIGATK